MSSERKSAIEAVLRELAEQIAAEAPAGWKRAELCAYSDGPNGSGHRGFTFEPSDLNVYGSNDIDIYDLLGKLHPLMEALGHLTIELNVDARGKFVAVMSEQLDRTPYDGNFAYLLDSEALPPEPGSVQKGSTAPEAGDPDEAVALLRSYLLLRAEILGDEDTFDPPAPLPSGRRREIEESIGVPLPADLRALYGVLDGDDDEGLLDRHPWFDLETLAEVCDPANHWWQTREWRYHEPFSYIQDLGPALAVRRMTDHPAWIPFATSTGGDFLAVDMAPGPRGRPGQVIRIGMHHSDGPVYVADSVTSLLRSGLEALQAGRFVKEDGELWLRDADDEQGDEDPNLLKVSGRAAVPVQGMHPDVRELKVGDAPWVELGTVRDAPALWKVSMANCPGADLTPLRDTPVEVVDLALDTIELAGLQGHPTLRSVALRSERPVDLRPLLSCPRLYALDLSDATAADIGVVGELHGLLYLRMQRPQWDELFQRKAIPKSLAFAELAREPLQEKKFYWSFANTYKGPRPTLQDAIEWADKLTDGDSGIQTFKGKFTPPRRR